MGVSNLVGLEGSFLRENPAGIKGGSRRKRTWRVGKKASLKAPYYILLWVIDPKITQQDCTVPSGFSPAERIDDHSIIFDNPGPSGQESRTPLYWFRWAKGGSPALFFSSVFNDLCKSGINGTVVKAFVISGIRVSLANLRTARLHSRRKSGSAVHKIDSSDQC